MQKSCPMYLLHIYFIFKSTKILPYFVTSNQHFTGMPEYAKHTILNTLHIFYIYNKNNLHSLYYILQYIRFSFLNVCVSKCVAEKYSIFIVNPVHKSTGIFYFFLFDKHYGHSTTSDIIKFNFYPYNNFVWYIYKSSNKIQGVQNKMFTISTFNAYIFINLYFN